MGKKGETKKKRLASETKKTRRIPAFVMVRTKGKVTHNRRSRNWRTDKLRIADTD